MGRLQDSRAIHLLEERIRGRSGYLNPFAWVPNSLTLALASVPRRDQLTLQAENGTYVMRYFVDQNVGPMFAYALGSYDQPDAAVALIRPTLRALSEQLRAAAQMEAAGGVEELNSYLEWTLQDKSEVQPRLEAAFANMWRDGRAPEDPGAIAPHLKDAKQYNLHVLAVKFAILSGISWQQVATRRPLGDPERLWALYEAERSFEDAVEMLESTGQDSHPLMGTATQLRDTVARDPDYLAAQQ